MILPNYALEYDERLDAMASLEILVEILPKVITAPHQWKWAVLSLHAALQGFMVLALQGTNDLDVLRKDHAIAWMEFYEGKKDLEKPLKLDYFDELYKKIKSDVMLKLTHSKKFEPSPSQDESVRRLQSERNNLAHYVPATSLLDVRVWVELILDVIPIIEFLVFESNNVSFYEEEKQEQVRAMCKLALSQAQALQEYFTD